MEEKKITLESKVQDLREALSAYELSKDYVGRGWMTVRDRRVLLARVVSLASDLYTLEDLTFGDMRNDLDSLRPLFGRGYRRSDLTGITSRGRRYFANEFHAGFDVKEL